MKTVLGSAALVVAMVATGGCSDEPKFDPENVKLLVDAGSESESCGKLGETCFAGEGECRRSGTYVCNGSDSVCGAIAAAPAVELCGTQADEDCDGNVDEVSRFGCCDDRDCDPDEVCAQDDELQEGRCVADEVSQQAPAAEPVPGPQDEIDEPGSVEQETGADSDMMSSPPAPAPAPPEDMPGADEAPTPTDPVIEPNPDESAMADESDMEPASDEPACENEGDTCSVGVGACKREGVYSCTIAGATCSVWPGLAEREVCDTSIDEDCDGSIDEAPEGGCCDSADCAESEECRDGIWGKSCVPLPDRVDPAPVGFCGDGLVDASSGEACDPGEPNVVGLCDENCNVTSAMYASCQQKSTMVACFPGQGRFTYAICGDHNVCTIPCSSDSQCQSASGRAADARCVPYSDGQSYCFDVCTADADCPSGQNCGPWTGFCSTQSAE